MSQKPNLVLNNKDNINNTRITHIGKKEKGEKKQGRPGKHGDIYKPEKKARQRGGGCQKSVCRTFQYRGPFRRALKCIPPKAASPPTSSNASTYKNELQCLHILNLNVS